MVKRIVLSCLLSIILLLGGAVRVWAPVSAAPVKSKDPVIYTSSTLCLNRPEIDASEMHWLYVPSYPSELYTEMNYGYLAGQLILSGLVDASSCPNGGIGANDYANACGLAAAKSLSIYYQNLYDETIINSFRETGVPPVALKQLMRYESQFWPGEFGLHYGVGHLTYYGAHTALNWSPYLRQVVCNTVYREGCGSKPVDDLMIGTFLGMMSSRCPSCENGINEAKAKQSAYYLSHSLLAYCRQTTQVVANATGRDPAEVVDYPMIWRLTLYNYNAGSNCLNKAIIGANPDDEELLDWNTFSKAVKDSNCTMGITYVNNITEYFYEFPLLEE